MDAVRFGRVLGFGARQAVKTVSAAVDAAAARNPSRKIADPRASPASASPTPPRPPCAYTHAAAGSSLTTASTATGNAACTAAQTSAQTTPQTVAQTMAQTEAQTVVQAHSARQALRRGSRSFREAAWKPFVRLSGVLWLEVSGVFFGIFALFALAGVLRLRAAWHSTATDAPEHRQLLGALAMLTLFGYFCVSNFVRARRRERRR